ncbi:MAG: transglutaminase domain-containing protein [Hymenobacter sp.]|nr:transglutaminase domain-containing protein [Hymenobacter sp.]
MKCWLTLLVCCLLRSPVLLAQPTQPARTKAEFEAYFIAMQEQVQPLVAAKQYSQVLALYADWHKAYDALEQPVKQEFKSNLPNLYYNEACYYALAQDRPHALASFQRAISSGYRNYAHAKTDTDLDFIRNDKGFQSQMAAIREKGDYLYILQQTKGYTAQSKQPLPAFTYQTADEPHLVALRKTYKLDSVAGAGNEVSRMINLLHWVHELVPHDGNHNNPPARNAQDFIRVCQRDKRGLNCRGLATVLNEVYLAMGYKARFVGCLPKDTTDSDSHVINIVYSTTQNKWLWMDPTHDAYVMNEQGNLLSVEEVRERLINGKPLLLNPAANWNHRESTTKEHYLYQYMAKNLYQLESPVSSQYDLETRREGKRIDYIRLLPAANNEKPVRITQVGTTTLTSHATTAPAAFWQKPLGDEE